MSLRGIAGTFVCQATVGIIMVVSGLCGLVLWHDWSNIYKDAQDRNTTLAFLLAEQTTRTFQAVDLTLAGIESVYRAAPLPVNAATFEALLRQRVSELDFIHSLYVLDASGSLVQSSGPVPDVLPVSAVLSYMQSFRHDPTLKLLIAQPLFGRPGLLSSIPVVRPLSGSGGEVDGLVVASVEPRYFSTFYRNVDLGRGGSIELYQDNGSNLLASSGSPAAMPMPTILSTAPMPMFDIDSQLGLIRSRSATAGPRLLAYHRAQGYPLVVAIGQDIKDLWARWWKVAAPVILVVLIGIGMSVAIAILVARRLEERHRAQNRAMMMQKLEALGQMTASVSHDFRNLLAVMQSTLRLIRKHGPTEKILSAAEQALDRGSALVTQLLAFSKRHELEVKPADINDLLANLAQVLRHAAGPAITLSFDTGTDLPLCKADQTQFDAALMNLVVNARQAMPQGGTIILRTRLKAAASGKGVNVVELQVRDTGLGIAPHDLKRIFEPFFTTKAETGTGLGLSQVFNFMRQIGGDVSAVSDLGNGTTFTLLFPVVEEPASRRPTPDRETAPRGLATSVAREHQAALD